MRIVPSRELPVPSTVSPALQDVMALEQDPSVYRAVPRSVAQWQQWIGEQEREIVRQLGALRERLGVSIAAKSIAGINCYEITPNAVASRHRDQVIVNVHGGGYVVGSGESGTVESLYLAGLTGVTVIAIDYRMPPMHPFPAALNDAMAVWSGMANTTHPSNIVLNGSSAGGGLALSMIQCALREGLPLPAALIVGTPWSDLSKTGDSYYTNEGVDNRLVSYAGRLEAAAKLYAHGRDLKDPLLSPVYGDFHGFPPTLLITGTRDLFLSNTVRVHRKLRQAGVAAQLEVYEGQSHAQFLINPQMPETRELFTDIKAFLATHLPSSSRQAGARQPI